MCFVKCEVLLQEVFKVQDGSTGKSECYTTLYNSENLNLIPQILRLKGIKRYHEAVIWPHTHTTTLSHINNIKLFKRWWRAISRLPQFGQNDEVQLSFEININFPAFKNTSSFQECSIEHGINASHLSNTAQNNPARQARSTYHVHLPLSHMKIHGYRIQLHFQIQILNFKHQLITTYFFRN